jgi:hypothetical protein
VGSAADALVAVVSMKVFYFCLFVLLLPVAGLAQSTSSATPQIVEVPSGGLHLKAYFWKPAGPGPFLLLNVAAIEAELHNK